MRHEADNKWNVFVQATRIFSAVCVSVPQAMRAALGDVHDWALSIDVPSDACHVGSQRMMMQLHRAKEFSMPIGQPTQLFINGKFVNSVSGKTFVTHNPANEQACHVAKGDFVFVDCLLWLF